MKEEVTPMGSHRSRSTLRWSLLSTGALLAAGCGSDSNNGGSATPGPSPTPGTGGPSLQITAPAANATNASPDLPVTVQATGFQIVNNPGAPNAAGQGHLVYWIDTNPTSNPNAPGGTPMFQSTFEIGDMTAPGTHTLYIELRNNDGTPLSTRVIRSVTFTTPQVRFAQDVLPIFTNNGAKTCAQSGCHSGSSATFSGGQNLEAANAYANIVNVASTEKPTLKRVQPGDGDASYLYQKIKGEPGIAGARMPLAGGPLDDDDIDRIELWINQGALNN
jgi:hypothetical protein